MKSTPLTQGASTLILAVYLLHTFMTSPFVTVLIAIASGVIAYGLLESYELGVAFAVVVGVLYGLLRQTKFSYETKFTKEGFNTDTEQQIVARVKQIKEEGPRGVLASAFAEGFADATTDNSGNEVTATSTAKTTSADTKAAPATTNGNAGSGIPPPAAPAAATNVAKAAATGGSMAASDQGRGQASAASGFTGSSKKDMEFKLGVIPEETKGGFHIDQGTTVMNALNALKPDQIKAMTDDTRKLIDTQKNLMSMLGTMKPMLQDGKEMMVNFQEMFGNSQMKV
jgi:hypothetical protein